MPSKISGYSFSHNSYKLCYWAAHIFQYSHCTLIAKKSDTHYGKPMSPEASECSKISEALVQIHRILSHSCIFSIFILKRTPKGFFILFYNFLLKNLTFLKTLATSASINSNLCVRIQ